MIVTIVKVKVKEGFIEDFLEATHRNHLNSVEEPGNLRFDVLRESTDPASFVLYEAYDSEERAAAHKLTGHYQEWKSTVEKMMATPRQGTKYEIIYPGDKGSW